MRKYAKLFTLALVSFLISSTSVLAREMNIEELGEEASKIASDAGYVYILGEYGFTSNYTITQEAIILASSSLDLKDPTDLSQVVIYQIVRKRNDNYEAIGWEQGENVLGSKAMPQTVNVKYIDMKYVKDIYTVTFDLDGGSFAGGEKKLTVMEDDKINAADITGANRPTRANKQFKEWVLVKAGTETPWDFTTPVKENMTLKATWYDEVNTDNLLENAKQAINAATKGNGYYYDVAFDANTSTLTFEVYDKNKKNSDISNTGLIGDIVNIVNNANIESLSISNGSVSPVVFTKEDVKDGAGPTSAAWKQFAVLLCTLTGKDCSDEAKVQASFQSITLGDLLKLSDLTLTINVNEAVARSQNNKTVENYKVNFAYDAKATLDKEILESDVASLRDEYNYTVENTYTVTGTDGEYKVEGYITEQDGVKGFGASQIKYHFTYSIKLEEGINLDNVTIKIPKTDTPKSDSDYNIYKKSSFPNGEITVIMEVEEKESITYRDIIVEVDGKPTKIRVDFTDLKLRKNSNSTISSEDAQMNGKLSTSYGWTASQDYSVQYKTTNNRVEVTGLLPIFTETPSNLPFKEDHVTGYYIAFAIQTKETNAKTKVTIQDGEESITWEQKDFDNTNTIYILKHLHPEKEARTFTIEVDMDGEGTEYETYPITVDWSGLTLQKRTVPAVDRTAVSASDKEYLENIWGYKFDANSNLTLSGENGTYSFAKDGKLTQQVLNDGVYDEKKGYYFDITFQLPKDIAIDFSKIKISALKEAELNNSEKIKKTFQENEYDKESKTLTIIQQILEDPKCTETPENCKSYYSVDYDGEGKEYLPTLVTIDYSKLTFEKSSIFTVAEMEQDKASLFGDAGWYKKDAGYSVNVTGDESDSHKYKISGLLPILKDSDWNGQKPNFTENGNQLYYLGLALTFDNVPANYKDQLNDKIKIEFANDALNTEFKKAIQEDSFETTKKLYILKALQEVSQSSETPEEKYFTITVDLDGEAEEYAAYTVTVDYSKLEFQKESSSTQVKPLASVDTDPEHSSEPEFITREDYEKIEGWGYDFKNIGSNFAIADGVLTGSIKEQNVDQAGFKNSDGYFVLVKIYGPTKDKLKNSALDKKWTIQLQDEDGKWKDPEAPTEADYENGFTVVLFRLDKEKDKIKYKIDWDGEENYFLPHEETIDYSQVTFLNSHEITFQYQNSKESVTFWDGETIVPPETVNPTENDYRKFAYWNKEDGTKLEDITLNEEIENITLVPHWNLYSDKFVADVLKDINEKSNTKFVIKDYDNSGNIVINVINPETTLAEMNETSIPGAIAYILLKDEIKEITLEVGDQSQVFKKDEGSNQETLKQAIQNGAKEVYKDILTNNFGGATDDTITLSRLAQNETYNHFTLKFDPEKVAKTVTFVKTPTENGISLAADIEVPVEYTFTFQSDVVSVQDEGSLKEALNGHAKTIYIKSSFAITSPIDIAREVLINGNDQALTSNTGASAMFNVKHTGVTIENMTLQAQEETKTFISVENSGNLTTNHLTITPVETESKLEAAIEVKEGGYLTAEELEYEKEHYNNPAVRAEKNATVKLTDKDKKVAIAKEKEKINKAADAGNDTKVKDSAYTYMNYYNKPENSMIYKTELYNYQAGSRLAIIKYNYYNENVEIPEKLKNFQYNGETYDLFAFSENSYDVLRGNDTIQSGDVAMAELKATKDNGHYWAVYKVTLQEGVKKVSDAQAFKEAIADGSTNAIYVNTSNGESLTIDYTEGDGVFQIDRDISITGPSNLKVTIKAKKIVINADKVLINRIDLQVEAQDGQKELIEVKGTKFSLYQSTLRNIGQNVDYAIKYTNENSIVDIRYMGRGSSGFIETNIDKAYIYVAGMAAGSDLFSNEFKSANPEQDKKSAIIINGFAANASITDLEDGEPVIRFENNGVTTYYAIVFTKNVSSQKADIKLGNSKIKVGVEYDEDPKDFSGITLYATSSNVETIYIDANQLEQTEKPGNVTGLSFKPTVVAGDPVSETASIHGLVQNEEGKYSGVVSQSDDGKFYLPLTLTSNQFADRTSKVTVIDPNGNTQDYLYSEYSEGGAASIKTTSVAPINTQTGVMKLNLEAIKASKIEDGNKEYTIKVDYDGNGVAESTYTIDYNDVKTLEEVINKAAENTANANSLTMIKNNKIKGLTEHFTYQYDKDNYVALYTDLDKANMIEYSFRYNKVVPEHIGNIVLTLRKNTGEANCTSVNDKSVCRPKLNNSWEIANTLSSVSMGSHEMTLLQDVMSKTTLNALDKVVKAEEENTYIVTLNQDRLNYWLDNAYLSKEEEDKQQKDSTSSIDEDTNKDIKFEVVLDSTNNYIVSLKSLDAYTIKTKTSGMTYTDNKIDVQFQQIGNTVIKEPSSYLAETEDAVITKDEFEDFFAKILEWHKESGRGEIYTD